MKIPLYAKVSILFLGIFVFVYSLYLAQSIVVPLLYATLFAILLSPLLSFFERMKMNRLLAIILTVLIGTLTTLVVISLVIWQVHSMSGSFTGFQESLNVSIQKSIVWISDTIGIKQQKINKWINELRTDASSNSSMMIGKTLYSVSLFGLAVVLLPIYALMLLYYEPLFVEFIRRLFDKSHHAAVAEIMVQIRTTVQSYLRGLLVEGAIVATLNSLALLALGIQYAILIGIIGAILNVIPFIGGFAAVVLPVLIALVTKGSSTYALLVLAALVLVQFIDNHYLIPKIVASKVKINALISVLVVLAGDALWGIPGMFLSIPLIAIIKIIFDHIEPLKPWGYLLGDDIPSNTIISVFFKTQKQSKPVANKVK